MARLPNFDDVENEQTEISAKIMRRRKNQSFYYQNQTKSVSMTDTLAF